MSEECGRSSSTSHCKALPFPQTVLQGIDPQSPFPDQFNRIFTHQSVGCRLFIDAIVHDHAVVPSLYDGLKVQEIMEAPMESHEQGRWVDVS